MHPAATPWGDNSKECIRQPLPGATAAKNASGSSPSEKQFPPVRCLQTTRPKKIKKKLLVEKGGVHPQFGHSTFRLATFFFIFLKPPATCQAHLEAIGTSSLNPKALQRKKFHREDASQKAFSSGEVLANNKAEKNQKKTFSREGGGPSPIRPLDLSAGDLLLYFS